MKRVERERGTARVARAERPPPSFVCEERRVDAVERREQRALTLPAIGKADAAVERNFVSRAIFRDEVELAVDLDRVRIAQVRFDVDDALAPHKAIGVVEHECVDRAALVVVIETLYEKRPYAVAFRDELIRDVRPRFRLRQPV